MILRSHFLYRSGVRVILLMASMLFLEACAETQLIVHSVKELSKIADFNETNRLTMLPRVVEFKIQVLHLGNIKLASPTRWRAFGIILKLMQTMMRWVSHRGTATIFMGKERPTEQFMI